MLDLGTVLMGGAIKRVTMERGHDPRTFVLFAFGGGGPLHAVALAREMAIPTVIVPPQPSVFAAFGMLLADTRADFVTTFLRPLDGDALPEMEAAFAAMAEQADAALVQDSNGGALRFERHAEMRYHGQRQTFRVRLNGATDVASLRATFEARYHARYGQVEPDGPLDLVNLILTAWAPVARPDPQRLFRVGRGTGSAPGQREMYCPDTRARQRTKVFSRATLPAGFAVQGPALIEEYGATTYISGQDVVTVGDLGELRIAVGGSRGRA